jgi:hypothetical protein
MAETNNIDDLVVQDPYFLWRDMDYGARLSREAVAAGLAHWLACQLRWIWDQQTEVPIPWYLSQQEGLLGWCKDEADLRIGARQDSWSAVEFHSLHFAEALRDDKRRALQDPFWNDLFMHKKAEGDDSFFAHIPILIGQAPHTFLEAKRLFALRWDRAVVPLRFWSYSAIEAYLEELLAWHDRHGIAPSQETLRQWVRRMGLQPFRPAVVTRYVKGKGIPIDGFCPEALVLARIPVPIDFAGDNVTRDF